MFKARNFTSLKNRYQGAHLASIHSDDTRRFLSSVEGLSYNGETWIGLNRNNDGGFEWTDNSRGLKMPVRK